MKKFIFTIIALLGILMPNTAWAQDGSEREAYGVILTAENEQYMTLYYDDKKASHAEEGLVVGINELAESSEIMQARRMLSSVIFDQSFADCDTIKSTAGWFAYCMQLRTIIGLEYLNTSEVTDMSAMFMECAELESLDLSHFNTSKVTNMNNMFFFCEKLQTMDLSSFDTENVTDMSYMFGNCMGLTTIYASGKWSTASVTESEGMFSGCSSLVGSAGTTYSEDHTDKAYAHIDGGADNPGYFTEINAQTSYDVRVDVVGYGKVKIGEMEIDNSGMVTLSVDRGGSLTLTFVPDEGYKLGSVTVGSTTGSNDVTSQVETSGTGAQTYTLNNVYDTYLIMVTYVNDEPKEQVAAPTFGFEGYDLTMATETEDATIRYMMEEWTYENIDSAYVQADKMTVDISGAIYDGPLGTVTHNVIVKAYASKDDMIDSEISTLVYYGRAWLKLQETIDYGERLFSEANGNEKVNQELLENLHWALEEGAMMYGRRAEAPSQEATMWTEHITELCKQVEEQMNAGSKEPEAYACQNGEDGSMLTFFYNDARSINGGYLIEEFRADSLVAWREIKDQIRYVAFDSSFAEFRPNSTAHWFEGFSNLENVSSLENLNTSEVYDMEAMFAGCKKLTTLAGIETLNTSNVVNMYRMFTECSSLEYLDVSHFDTSNSVITCNMFSFCSSLESLDMSGFNTSKVGDFSHMFAGCTNLKSIDVSHFDTSNGVHMGSIFAQCSSLTSIDLSSFNTEKAEGMSMLFQDCTGLTNIDVSNFNTSNVTSIDRMFDGCTGLTTLDLSNFDTGKVTAIFQMFKDCSNLKTIYVSDKWTTDSVKEGFQVFANCQSIVGGAGTQFDPEHTDYTYAHIDGRPDNPGYFTQSGSEPYTGPKEQVATPTFSFIGDSLVISCATEGASLWYASREMDQEFDDGFAVYDGPIYFTLDIKVIAKATKEGMEDSKPDTLYYYYSDWQRLLDMTYRGEEVVSMARNNEAVPRELVLTLEDSCYIAKMYYDEGRAVIPRNNVVNLTYSIEDMILMIMRYIEESEKNYATYENYVLTVEGETSMAQALEQVGGREVVAKSIAAIVWNSSEAITLSDIEDLGNPNMLIYVQTDSQAPEGVNNVIIDGKAKNIVLVDADSINNNFYAPQEFTAENIQYTREFKQTTEKDVSRGWEGICLPFNVETYTHESHGAIAPFRNDASEYHFWLHQMTDQGMQIATTIEANKPYIISMPNNGSYPAVYNQAGKVTFAAKNVRISESIPWAMILADGSIGIAGAYQSISYGFYALNVGSEYEGYAEGSVFVNNYRGIRPFEVYGWHNGRDNEGAGARFISLSSLFGGNGTTGIIDVMNTVEPNSEVWYDMNGRRLQSKPVRKGVYIHNGKKVVRK